jgi:hypothetical protein
MAAIASLEVLFALASAFCVFRESFLEEDNTIAPKKSLL